MFSLVEIKNIREKKKIIKLIKSCDIRNKHSKKCYIKLNKEKKSAAKLFCKILCSSGKHERYLMIYYLNQIMYKLSLKYAISAIVSFFIVH